MALSKIDTHFKLQVPRNCARLQFKKIYESISEICIWNLETPKVEYPLCMELQQYKSVEKKNDQKIDKKLFTPKCN